MQWEPEVVEQADKGVASAHFFPSYLCSRFFIFCSSGHSKRKRSSTNYCFLQGDRVISSGGLHGVVTGLTDDVVTMEIAPKVRVKVSRGSISGITGKGS